MTTLHHQVRIATSLVKLFERLSTEDGIGSWWDRPNNLQKLLAERIADVERSNLNSHFHIRSSEGLYTVELLKYFG